MNELGKERKKETQKGNNTVRAKKNSKMIQFYEQFCIFYENETQDKINLSEGEIVSRILEETNKNFNKVVKGVISNNKETLQRIIKPLKQN